MSNGYANGRPENSDEGAAELGPSRSGRRFVIVAAVALLILWGVLFLVFRDWRARHRELSAFGAREVAALVDPLAEAVPPGVSAPVWRDAVSDTHAMLETLTAAGVLDRGAMLKLRADLQSRFAKITPENAVDVLATLWDDMLAQAGPILTQRSSRPPFCPPRPEILSRKTGAKP